VVKISYKQNHLVNSVNFTLRGHLHNTNVTWWKCHMTIMSLRFKSHSNHICLHTASLSVTWCKQSSRDVNNVIWLLTSLSLGLVCIAAICADISITDPGKPAASSLRRKLSQCHKSHGLSWDRVRASITHINQKYHCREKLHTWVPLVPWITSIYGFLQLLMLKRAINCTRHARRHRLSMYLLLHLQGLRETQRGLK
jgi:hypothetical protein